MEGQVPEQTSVGPLGTLSTAAQQAKAAGPITASIHERLQASNETLNEYMLNMRDELLRLTGRNAITHDEKIRSETEAETPQQSGFIHDMERGLSRYYELLQDLEQLRTQLSQL